MDEQQITPTFKKREFVIQTKEQYPQTLCFECTQDKTSLIDALSVGQEVNVQFNLRGREWTPQGGGDTRYFTSLQAWRINAVAAQQEAPAGPPAGEPFVPPTNFSPQDDDLPF